MQGCRLAGAATIIAVDTAPAKLQAAERFGATNTICPTLQGETVAKAVRKLTGSGGADYCFEAVGSQDTYRAAFDSTRPGGMCVVVGVAPAAVNALSIPG